MFSGPASHPCSDTGRLQSDISQLERSISNKADSWEVSSLKEDVSRLQYKLEDQERNYEELRSRLTILEEKE